MYEITDDWSKLLILSATANKLPNQAVEINMAALMRSLRPPVRSAECKLKLMIICYYLMSRPLSLLNHILLFELVSHFLGISPYFDGLILGLFSRVAAARVYALSNSKKLSQESLDRMAEIIATRKFDGCCTIKALPCFIISDRKPSSIILFDTVSSLLDIKALEYICFYVKYTQHSEYIKEVIPSHPLFLDSLGRYMQGKTELVCTEGYSLTNCPMESREIFDALAEAYKQAHDKARFISEITDFLVSLK